MIRPGIDLDDLHPKSHRRPNASCIRRLMGPAADGQMQVIRLASLLGPTRMIGGCPHPDRPPKLGARDPDSETWDGTNLSPTSVTAEMSIRSKSPMHILMNILGFHGCSRLCMQAMSRPLVCARRRGRHPAVRSYCGFPIWIRQNRRL